MQRLCNILVIAASCNVKSLSVAVSTCAIFPSSASTDKMVRVIYIWSDRESEYIVYASLRMAFSASGEMPAEIGFAIERGFVLVGFGREGFTASKSISIVDIMIAINNNKTHREQYNFEVAARLSRRADSHYNYWSALLSQVTGSEMTVSDCVWGWLWLVLQIGSPALAPISVCPQPRSGSWVLQACADMGRAPGPLMSAFAPAPPQSICSTSDGPLETTFPHPCPYFGLS